MKFSMAILVAGFLVSVGAADDEAGKADLRKLEGVWKVVSLEVADVKVKAGPGRPEKLVIKDGKMTIFSGGKEVPTAKNLRLVLDPNEKPKAVDLVRGEKESLPCIYEVTADKLKLAMPLIRAKKKPGERIPRPESFDTQDAEKDKPFLVLTAKRSKN